MDAQKRKGLAPHIKLFNALNRELDTKDVEYLKDLLDDQIPRGNLERLDSPMKIFKCLMDREKITSSDMDLLIEVFNMMDKKILKGMVIKYLEDEGHRPKMKQDEIRISIRYISPIALCEITDVIAELKCRHGKNEEKLTEELLAIEGVCIERVQAHCIELVVKYNGVGAYNIMINYKSGVLERNITMGILDENTLKAVFHTDPGSERANSLDLIVTIEEPYYHQVTNAALLHTAEDGKHIAVEQCLGEGADIEARDEDNWTGLHIACSKGHSSVVQTLLKSFASVDAVDKANWTGLHLACQHGHNTVVQTLLKSGAHVDAVTKDTWTGLHLACQNGHDTVVQTLLKSGASVNAEGEDKYTGLHLACENGHDTVVQTLLKSGASVDAVTKDGSQGLHLASRYGHDTVVQTLLKGGASVNAVDENNRTGLHLACQHGHGTVVQTLLEGGASVDAVDKENMTALQIALLFGYIDIEEMLVHSGDKETTFMALPFEAGIGGMTETFEELQLMDSTEQEEFEAGKEGMTESIEGSELMDSAEQPSLGNLPRKVP